MAKQEDMVELALAVQQVAAQSGIEAAALQAVVEVECGGQALARIGERFEPLIRFEGHYFHRLLPAARRNQAVVAGLAHPVAGRVANPLRQADRWKMLERACAVDRPAALASTSWGVGQVMGAHWRWLGYSDVEHLVSEARGSVEGQVKLFARFVGRAGLADKLEGHDWRGFARAYNGPAFARHGYDVKMAKAYARITASVAKPSRHALAVLGLGSHGAAVEALQHDLRRLGHPLIADGDFGPATQAALRSFQQAEGLAADGVFGADALEAMGRRGVNEKEVRSNLTARAMALFSGGRLV